MSSSGERTEDVRGGGEEENIHTDTLKLHTSEETHTHTHTSNRRIIC